MADVSVNLELAIESFKKSIQESTNQTKRFADAASTNFSSVRQSFNVMAGTLAAQGISRAFGAIIGSFNDMINEAAASEQAIQNLNIALRQAGLFSQQTSDDFLEFASSIQNITIYSDDAVLSSIQLLASLTNLDEKGLKQATSAAVDLAATLNIDLATATEMINKAINGNVSAFQRIGIEIKKGSTDAENLQNVLSALATQEGAAAAATNTYTGARAKQNNAISDFLKAIGKLIVQNELVISAINATSQVFLELAGWISKNQKFINDLAKAVAITTGIFVAGYAAFTIYTAGLALVTAVTAGATSVFGLLSIAASAAWAAITAPITLVVAGIVAVGAAVYQVVKNWDDIKISIFSAIAATLEYAAIATSVFSDSKAQALQAEAQAWRDKAQAIKDSTLIEAESSALGDEQAQQRKAKLAQELSEVTRINGAKSEQARIQAETLLQIENEKNIRIAEIESGYLGSQLSQRQAHEQAMLQLQIDAEIARAQLQTDAKAREEALQAATDKSAIEKAKLRAQQEAQIAQNRVANQKDTLSTIATLASSNNKTLAAIGKAAGLVQLAIDGPVAVGKALAAFPPPFNFAAATAVGAAFSVQAAQLVGVKFAEGGIVPGANMTGDRVQARLNSGEMVLNQRQQSNLFKIANEKSNSTGDSSRVEVLLENLIETISNQPLDINIDGKNIFSAIRSEINSGRTF